MVGEGGNDDDVESRGGGKEGQGQGEFSSMSFFFMRTVGHY